MYILYSQEKTIPFIYLYINPICLPPLNKGGPQPIVDIWVANVADDVAPPVYPLVKVCEALLNPACNEKRVGQMYLLDNELSKYMLFFCL